MNSDYYPPMSRWCLSAVLIGLLHVAPVVAQRAADETPRPVTSRRGLVVSVSGTASDVGAGIMARGGNAVDAAVATALALAVTHPAAGNLGGGGFMMILPKPGAQPVCIDYRETAPAAATPTMFSLDESHLGTKAVGVPGTVRGLALAHQRYGSLSWREIVGPAIRLARDGFAVGGPLTKSLNEILQNRHTAPFTELQRVLAPPHGDAWTPEDRLVQPDLARTLKRIAEQGADGFYRGMVAESIVAEMQRGGGLITLSDLAAYEAKMREPIHGTYRGLDVFGPPPPSSGGITLIEMLNILENFDLQALGHESPEAAHLMLEAMRRSFLDRARYLGDQDFVRIPEFLTSKSYATSLARHIDPASATSSVTLAPDIPLVPEEDSTTHFSILDAHGMAVANTYTLEQSYGSRVVVQGCGFLLNNEMGDFNWVPGHTDHQGRIGTKPNLVQPRKRMLSSQTPVLVLKDGRPYLITGSPGGRTIINTVLCILVNLVDFQMDLPAAVSTPRWHHQWLPDEVDFEAVKDPQYAKLIEQLQAMGHTFDPKAGTQGDAHSILFDAQSDTITGVADRRINGKATPVEQFAE